MHACIHECIEIIECGIKCKQSGNMSLVWQVYGIYVCVCVGQNVTAVHRVFIDIKLLLECMCNVCVCISDTESVKQNESFEF